MENQEQSITNSSTKLKSELEIHLENQILLSKIQEVNNLKDDDDEYNIGHA